ncbi:CueP family metal-binding protein [Aquibacillus sediminis]|uniref:CueP family metal-binding protein n=1 Tax=Aquibacillus sediminis TaxID=2574734 RepID=UPI001107B4A5|nr:CueP family metal-binding protein [Aquibacillus sediminis]
MNKKIMIAGIAVVVLIALVVLTNVSDNLNQNKGEAQDIKKLINDYTLGNVQAQNASVTSEELIVTGSDSNEEVYEMPEDEFFVSIAPYVEQTHPCSNHSLTGCQGEMAKEDFEVYIEDEEGNAVVDETITSQANGFIDLWLPRDKTYSIKISNEGKSVESDLSTFEGDNTCITTMQLTDA